MLLLFLIPGVFEYLDEFDAPACVDDGTKVVVGHHWDQYQVHKVEEVQLYRSVKIITETTKSY